MKRGFQPAHGSLDLIQPHEQWEYTSNGVNPNPFSIRSIVPDQNISSPNMEKHELSMWVEHITKQLIEDLPETTANDSFQSTTMVYDEDNNALPDLSGEFRPKKTLKRSSSSSTTYCELLDQKIDDHGLSLMTLLMECAVAISVDNLGEAHRMLLELTQTASPYGPSCAERVVAYFSKAMSSRVINSWLGFSNPLINHKCVHSSFQFFNNISPFIKFAHFTSNQAILEAFHRRDRVHIIDLDVMQGLQWPALFHILATRLEGPPIIRMTGLGPSMDLLIDTGKQLSSFAKRLGLTFEFNPIAKKFGELNISNFQIRRGETLAVHWLQHALYDASGPDYKVMRLLQELSPRVVTLVEQDISHGGSFLDRFVGSLHYYSTIFDSLGAFLGIDDQSRHRVEHSLLYREINNVLAIGGPARSGEEKFRNWRGELGRSGGGFMQVGMSGNSMAQAQLILNMFPPSHGYSLVQCDGTLKLGWKETSLFTASAWTSNQASR